MAPSRSARNGSDSNTYDANALPPWERGNIAQVPYLESTSPSLSNAEREALPSLWAVQKNSTSSSRPRVDTHTRYASNSSQRNGSSFDDYSNPWGVKTPLTAPPPPRPYDTPVYIPPGPKSTPYPPTFTKPPPTPPDSDLGSFTTTSPSSSPQTKHDAKALPALPGHVESNQPSRPRKPASTRESKKAGSRMQRLKAALKDMFTHQPVDESDFVHIGDQRHWTEE